ncbi:MAG: site-2 protease family protein, partial [Parcubacteria group bacterium]
MITILIFLIILSLLVFVHEAGHFLAAKAFKVRVDEFGLGYPPRAKKLFSWRGTLFTLNWLPFGGFVRIFGENPSEENIKDPNSFSEKNRGAQALILSAGVFGNFLLAWILISMGLMLGMPSPEGLGLPVENVRTTITQILPDSPADKAGLKAGDTLVGLNRGEEASTLSPDAISAFIGESEEPVSVTVLRKEELIKKTIVPNTDIL